MSAETKSPPALMPGELGVDQIVDADISLEDRLADGNNLAVTLWLVKGANRMYITVEDSRVPEGQQPEVQRLEVPKGHNPLNRDRGMFYHPFAYMD